MRTIKRINLHLDQWNSRVESEQDEDGKQLSKEELDQSVGIAIGLELAKSIVAKDDFIGVAKEFFAWFNKHYPNPSNHPNHPWCKMGESLCNLDLSEANNE
jgi:hypothetical protein